MQKYIKPIDTTPFEKASQMLDYLNAQRSKHWKARRLRAIARITKRRRKRKSNK